MSNNLLEKIDIVLEDAQYLADYGIRIIKQESKMETIFRQHFANWKNKLIKLDRKHDYFEKIFVYANTFILKKEEKSEIHELQKCGCGEIPISKAAFPPLDGDALKIEQFTKEIMGEWNEYIREDLKGLSKQVDGAMIANFNVASRDFIDRYMQNVDNKVFHLKDKAILDAIESRAKWISARAGEMEWERITRRVANHYFNFGEHPNDIRKYISNTKGYIRTYKGRSISIARTEVAWAQNYAANSQMQKVGVPLKRFITEPRGEWPCEFCMANEAQGAIPVKDEFVSGPVPVHPRCRCAEIPVIPDDWSPVQEWFGEGNVNPSVVYPIVPTEGILENAR